MTVVHQAKRSLGSVVQSMAEIGRSLREDGWRSTLTGIGGRRDKGRHVRFCPSLQLDRETLAGVYRDSWLVRRIITAVPEEALRRGFGEELDSDDLPEFTRLNFERYPGEGALIRACNLARLMGGSMIYLGYRDGGADLTQPAREGAEVAFLEVFHRYELQADERSRVEDPSSARYKRPDVWEVVGQNRTHLRFHHSRAIVFPGQPRADNQETAVGTDRDWDDSVLQSMWDDVARYGLFWQSVSHLMQVSSVGVLKISGLIEMLTSQDQANAEARIDLLNEALSITRLMMLDASKQEEYHREAVSFTDVPALLQELQMATAGAVEMPVTVLFGRSPAGMNATGESDLRIWYDTVDTWRERVLKPRAEQLLRACERRKGITIEWPPLWEPTEKECAEVRNLKLQGDHILWQDGVLSEDEWRTALHEGKRVEELMKGQAPEPEPLALPPGDGAPEPGAPNPVDRARALLGDAIDETLVERKIERARKLLAVKLQKYETHAAKHTELKEAAEAAESKLAEAEKAWVSAADGDPAERELKKAYRVAKAEDNTASRQLSRLGEPDESEVQGALDGLSASYGEALQAFSDSDAPADRERYSKLKSESDAVDHIIASTVSGDFDAPDAKKAAAKVLQEGPRGGRYYLSEKGGSKVYVRDERALLQQDRADATAPDEGVKGSRVRLAAALSEYEEAGAKIAFLEGRMQSLNTRLAERLTAQETVDLADERRRANVALKSARVSERRAERRLAAGVEEVEAAHVAAYETAQDEVTALEATASEAYAARDNGAEGPSVQERLTEHKLGKARSRLAEAEADLDEVRAVQRGVSASLPKDHVAHESELARAIQEGPRGGRYYMSVGGSKTYV